MHSENNDAGAIEMVGQTQMEFDTPALYSSETQNTRTLEEIQRSWLLNPKSWVSRSRHIDLGCMICSRRAFKWMMWLLIVAVFVIVAPTIMTRSLPHHHPKSRIPDNYTTALHKVLFSLMNKSELFIWIFFMLLHINYNLYLQICKFCIWDSPRKIMG